MVDMSLIKTRALGHHDSVENYIKKVIDPLESFHTFFSLDILNAKMYS